MMCCLRSFAWCLQKCVEFINKNTYILVACRGQSFCTSAKEAFTIILANIATVATVSTITNFLILLGKVTITCLCMLIFNGFINGAEWVENIPTFQANVDMGTISSPIFPMLVVLLFAYAISSYFLNIYSMSIDTVLMCYMVDTKEYKVKFGALYMAADPDLDSTLKLADAKYGMAIHKSKGKRSAKGGTPTAESGVREAELSVVPGTGQEGEA
jgi:choline transporter-like protein 2/4/5